MEDEDEKVFINLTVIAKIVSGDKLIVENENLLNIDQSYLQCVTRRWNGANRASTSQFISTVLQHAFELNKRYTDEKNDRMRFRLTADLKNALAGLNNLKSTYAADKLVQSEIDVMMENIRSILYSNYT
jgi:hypothetical protein